jgi:hypothetical protein
MLNMPAGLKLSPLEKLCLEFNQLVRQFYKAPRYSKQGIVILRKIHEVRARLADELPPPAENEKGQPQLVRKAPVISWRAVTVEARFLWDALSHDLNVAIPFGSFMSFDVIVMSKASNYRVKVKYTTDSASAEWTANLVPDGGAASSKGDFDILAVLDPEEAWFIIPFKAVGGKKSIQLPDSQRKTKNRQGTMEKYRDGWKLFK